MTNAARVQQKTRQEKVREELEGLLGNKVAGQRFASVRVIGSEPFQDWQLDRLVFANDNGEDIPARFLRPPDDQPQVPAVLYCHAHGNHYALGCEELTEGRPALTAPYASDLRALGCAALCIEMPCFGGRQEPGEPARAKAHLWRGTTLFGHMLAELSAGLSFLADHPLVDGSRLGALGFSMGSTHAYWLAALDERVKATVALCSFADLETLIQADAHDGHGIYMAVPGQTSLASTGDIAGLTAPRALFIGAGMQDWSTPSHAFAKGRSDLEAAYADTPDALVFHVEKNKGHVETPAMRAAALAFLKDQLFT